MRQKVVVGNFKAELNRDEMINWLEKAAKYKEGLRMENKLIILAPQFVYLDLFKQEIARLNLPFRLAAQDVSRFEQGAYTGEVSVRDLKDFVEFVVIGHSERRLYFAGSEGHEELQAKINLAHKYKIKVILCVGGQETYKTPVFAVAYEPIAAIGRGYPEPAEQSYEVSKEIKKTIKAEYYLYGGSVNKDNVFEFTSVGFDGVIVGKKTLDPDHFLDLVANA